MKKSTAAPRRSIVQQIHQLLWAVAAAMAIIIVVMFVTMLSVNGQYAAVLQNANNAADFSKEFKNTIDSEMYNHVIRPRDQASIDDLPLTELDQAVSVLHRLEASTTLRDNRWRIQSMLNMCENLRTYMIEIAQTDLYDVRMELLERNIRGETGLTKLIETYMHDYIDDEVRELARLQSVVRRQTVLALVIVLAAMLLFSVGIVVYSYHITRRITDPIGALSQKAEQVGEGVFDSTPVQTNIIELQTLDRGFDEMAARVNALMTSQMENQRSLHRAELELLQAQINPHFLYNTLDSIAILAEMEREEDVVTMVTSLSSFFRNSLNKGEDIMSLRAECTHVTSYLEIQSIRYSDILRYEIHIPDELMDCLVPKLILQPLVENALYHGIKNRRGLGTITITGESAGSDMLLKVHDNGAGMDAERVQALQAGIYEDRHTGLGLLNVHKRIRLYCGEQYGLSFESEPGIGTTVSVLLPRNLTRDNRWE